MCFGGDRGDEAVIIRRRARPRQQQSQQQRGYVSRPEVATYRRETVTRRSTSAHRPSHSTYDHYPNSGQRQYNSGNNSQRGSYGYDYDPRRSGSRSRIVTEERRSRNQY